MKKCPECGRFYTPQKDEKMCKDCKVRYEIAFQKLQNNKALHDVMSRLSDK